MKLGSGEKLELNNSKKEPNIALANNEKKLNLYAKQSYHIQGLNQAKWGFWLSVVGAIGGFIIIVISIFLLIDGATTSIITLAAGTVVETISILFFTISNKASERVSNSFDKLRVDSNIVNSIELSKSIEDSNIRDELKVKLSLYLIGIKEERICSNTKAICNTENSSNICVLNKEIAIENNKE